MIRGLVHASILAGAVSALGAAGPAPARSGSQLEVLLARAGAERVACPADVAGIAPGETPLCGRTDPKAKRARKSLNKFLNAEHEGNRIQPWTRRGPWRHRNALVDALPFRIAFDTSRDLVAVSSVPLCFGDEFRRSEVHLPDDDRLHLPTRSNQVRVDYPERARRYRSTGTFEGWVLVDRDGRVADVCTIAVLPERMGFEEAAYEAIEQWRYEPGTLNGEPVPVVMYAWLEWTLGPR